MNASRRGGRHGRTIRSVLAVAAVLTLLAGGGARADRTAPRALAWQQVPEVIDPAQSNGPLPGTPQDLAAENAAVRQISSRIHYALSIPVQIFENRRQVQGQRVDGYTIAVDSDGNWNSQRPAAKCTIYLNPIAHVDQVTFRATIVSGRAKIPVDGHDGSCLTDS